MIYDPNKFYRTEAGRKVQVTPNKYLLDVRDVMTGEMFPAELYADTGKAFCDIHQYHPRNIVGEWFLGYLEAGKIYKTRDGKQTVKVYVHAFKESYPKYPFGGEGYVGGVPALFMYRADGKQDSQEEHPLDLIPEEHPLDLIPEEHPLDLIPEEVLTYTIQGHSGGRASIFCGDVWIGKFLNERVAREYLELLKNKK